MVHDRGKKNRMKESQGSNVEECSSGSPENCKTKVENKMQTMMIKEIKWLYIPVMTSTVLKTAMTSCI